MMITTTVLCASLLMFADAPAPQPAQAKTQQTAPANSKPNAAAKAQPKEAADKQPDLPEEKVVDGVKLAAVEASIVSFTNQERVRYGMAPLAVDKDLMVTAREHAAWMTRNQSMVHTSLPVAENIAMGQPDSSNVVRAWMNSSGHRANILNPGHRRIGVAAFRTAAGTIFWCQQFRN